MNPADTMIEITHYTNPHLFWFKYKAADNEEFKRFDEKVQIFSFERTENVSFIQARRGIRVGDLITVFHANYEKFIRCKVESVDMMCAGWAVDYGFPMKFPKTMAILIDGCNILSRSSALVFKAAAASIVPVGGVM